MPRRLGYYLLVGCITWMCGTVWAESRPNVLILVADDLGYSDLGCYGSEIATPNLDTLAANGTLFSNFHAAPTCSPTRAMLLTGVDHHLAGMGNMYEFLRTTPDQWGRPGYEGFLNDSVMTIAEVLKLVGYETAISGKWHLGQQLVVSQAPAGRGFDHSWVLWSGWSEQYEPSDRRAFIEGDRRVAYPNGRYSTEWYTDQAIQFADQAVEHEKPFFLMVSYTAPHWPLEAPVELIKEYMAKYQMGFDELRSRRIQGLAEKKILPPGIRLATTPEFAPPLQHDPPLEKTKRWDDLLPPQREHSAKVMAVHAAMIDAMDQQIGRLFDHLRQKGQWDNTLIIFLSDNGASSLETPADEPGNELDNVGRPGSFIAYGAEWARASSGPLRLMKGYPSEGGTRVPAIVKLPQNADQPRTIHELTTVLDIAPTIYELAGTTYPEKRLDTRLYPLEGHSMLDSLRGKSPTIRSEEFGWGVELFGRGGYRRGQWKITWIERPFGAGRFELFDVEKDPGESTDLSAQQPGVYQAMIAGWEEYVRQKGVVVSRPAHWTNGE